ncbi:MAG: uridine diphosphate-N-acetylglucosamine-binding protein YvcK [Actinomycetota bacterium]|nr:uridine diphosphate-N-acetylglucosamine-binding protein YvcK [Actinomycetota bacterium]
MSRPGASPGAAEGPRVVAVGGGHGLAASLRAMRTYAGDITAVVSVADDGGSTGRLRAAADRPAPGDLRKCLVALAEPDSRLAAAMEHRFDAGELEGHAFGNLMIVALDESGGDLVAALDEIGALLGAAGRVLPSTTHTVALHASVGSGGHVEGQVSVGACGDIGTVHLVPAAPAPPEALDAIATADQIVLGPGSLFTSVLAAAAADGITEAIAESPGALVYVCNLRPQLPETSGYDVAAHVSALERHGLRPDVVLYDPDAIDVGDVLAHAVSVPLARPSGLAHDPDLLGKALESLLG